MDNIAHSFHSISTEAAQLAVTAAVAHARRLGLAINAAVVDHGGTLMAFLRCQGAPLHSVDIAIDKAYTAVSFGLPTQYWDARLADRPYALRHGLMNRPHFAGFGGGLPILYQGQRIGAIGISGASESEDIACAEAGLAAILEHDRLS
ncbi:MAG: heme-binding protein [Pseudogulbenkiania sp.]|nr:heme-binding protein [Pseudogulbenkiania sp.]